MTRKKGRNLFSLNYLFASFFGAVMIALTFAYYNYKFSEYKFINFYENVFYEKKDIFTPKDERYTILIYSSNMSDKDKLLQKIKTDNKILAIDIYQKRFNNKNSIIYLTAGTNTLIKVIQNFNIYKVPVVFEVKKFNNKQYKQNSKIEVLE